MAGAFYEDVYDWWDYGEPADGRRLFADTPAWEEANASGLQDLGGPDCRGVPAGAHGYLLLQQLLTTR